MEPCPIPYPAEFLADVCRVVRQREAAFGSDRQGLRDLGSDTPRLVEEFGHRRGASSPESARLTPLSCENRSATGPSSSRAGTCAWPRRSSAPTEVRPGPRPCGRRNPRHGDLPGAGHPHPSLQQGAPGHGRRRQWYETHRINASIDIHNQDPAFGYRFIPDELTGARFQHSTPASVGCGTALKKASGASLPRRRASQEGRLSCCAIRGRLLELHRQPQPFASDDGSVGRLGLRDAIALRHPAATAVIHSDRGSIFDPCPSSACSSTTSSPVRWFGSVPLGGNAALEPLFTLLRRNVLNLQRGKAGGSSASPSSTGRVAPLTAGSGKRVPHASPRSTLRY